MMTWRHTRYPMIKLDAAHGATGGIRGDGRECGRRPALVSFVVPTYMSKQRLVEDADGIVPVLAQEPQHLLREVLVDLESHAALRPGNSTIRSRTSSTA